MELVGKLFMRSYVRSTVYESVEFRVIRIMIQFDETFMMKLLGSLGLLPSCLMLLSKYYDRVYM